MPTATLRGSASAPPSCRVWLLPLHDHGFGWAPVLLSCYSSLTFPQWDVMRAAFVFHGPMRNVCGPRFRREKVGSS